MKLIRKITERVARRNPIKYARKIGVKVGNECRFTGNPRWGSEPWLIQVGNHDTQPEVPLESILNCISII